ncbi:hypothetical protein GCM10027059_26130 [Myceligenerans halotolerans]
MTPLTLAHSRAHDLPPLWDGRRVEWTPWRDEPHTSMVFHAPAHEFACTGCGWIRDAELRAVGKLHRAPGETFTTPVERRTRSGHRYSVNIEVPARPVARLHVRRCPGCGLDEVTDIDTGEVWDLEESDYTDAGSWPEAVAVQGALF